MNRSFHVTISVSVLLLLASPLGGFDWPRPEQMKKLDHSIYGTFARNDTGIPVEQVNAFVAALRAAGIENDVHIYDEIQHGFWLHVDRDPKTNTAPALDAWRRLKAYLARRLGS